MQQGMQSVALRVHFSSLPVNLCSLAVEMQFWLKVVMMVCKFLHRDPVVLVCLGFFFPEN